jgi:hypothetical protein
MLSRLPSTPSLLPNSFRKTDRAVNGYSESAAQQKRDLFHISQHDRFGYSHDAIPSNTMSPRQGGSHKILHLRDAAAKPEALSSAEPQLGQPSAAANSRKNRIPVNAIHVSIDLPGTPQRVRKTTISLTVIGRNVVQTVNYAVECHRGHGGLPMPCLSVNRFLTSRDHHFL